MRIGTGTYQRRFWYAASECGCGRCIGSHLYGGGVCDHGQGGCRRFLGIYKHWYCTGGAFAGLHPENAGWERGYCRDDVSECCLWAGRRSGRMGACSVRKNGRICAGRPTAYRSGSKAVCAGDCGDQGGLYGGQSEGKKRSFLRGGGNRTVVQGGSGDGDGNRWRMDRDFFWWSGRLCFGRIRYHWGESAYCSFHE